MIRFDYDYSEGAHPSILKRLIETNEEQTAGYGEDPYCIQARKLIRSLCQKEQADVHFLVGGTQTNTTVIASILRPHQGVISAQTGHIHTHESGAIEATGHKVLPVYSSDGKITAEQVAKICKTHWEDPTREHTVQPGMVYISHPTENGTIYAKRELKALREACNAQGIPLYLDGARLGYAVMAKGNDLSIAEIADCCDLFYIGGTKIGALFGEAVVIVNERYQQDFRYHIKQRGGMLAKGRLLGIQFKTLFEDGLYFQMADHAVKMAMRIKEAFQEKGYSCLYDSTTNQQFPILPKNQIETLAKKYSFYVWEPVDDTQSALRFCTSWATKESHVDQLIEDIRNL